MPKMRWALITGEYPPQPGGVADYTRLLARGLAEAGDRVHVWSGPCSAPTPVDSGVHVHRLPGRFGPASLVQLHRELGRLPGPYRLLVQYVPHSFGMKAMNVPFCLWLKTCPRSRLWVMFHEVSFAVRPSQPWQRNLLGRVTRFMARTVARAAGRVFVSSPAWDDWLKAAGPGCVRPN